HEVGHAIDGNPGDPLALLGRGRDLRHLRRVGLDRAVARQARSGRREAGHVVLRGPRVAEVAPQTSLVGGGAMAEPRGPRRHRPRRRRLWSRRRLLLGKRSGRDDERRRRPHRPFGAAGRAKATTLPENALSYLLPPPAAITTN